MTEANEEEHERDQEANDVTESGRVREYEDADDERDDSLDAGHRPALPGFPGRCLPGHVLGEVLHPGIPFPVPDVMNTQRAGSMHYRRTPAWSGPTSIQRYPTLARRSSIAQTVRRESSGFHSWTGSWVGLPVSMLTVMTYNVGAGLAAPLRLVEVLRQSGADIIGLQELAPEQGAAIDDRLCDGYPHQVLHPTGIPGKVSSPASRCTKPAARAASRPA